LHKGGTVMRIGMIAGLAGATLTALFGCTSPQTAGEVSPKAETPEQAAGEEKQKEQTRIELPGDEFYSDHTDEVQWADRCTCETDHYVIESNCNESIRKRYAEMLEAYYAKWCELVCKPELDYKLRIRIYGSHKDFMDSEQRSEGVGGFYGAGRVTAYHGRFGKTGFTHIVLFHECTHQLHDAVMGIMRAQIWFTEGLACIFETLAFDEKDKLQPVFNNSRLKKVRDGVREGKPMELKKLLSTSVSDFRTSGHYAYAYLFVYYLLNTTVENNRIFREYWQILAKDGDPKESPKFMALIGGKEKLDALERRWRKWVLSLDSNDTPEKARTKALED
jgi:hypothetical protein